MTTKARLLANYAHKPVTRLAQFDCFAAKRCDDIIIDCGGYGCTMGVTHELMSMAPDARLLVSPNADHASVRKWLLAMAEKLERQAPFVLDCAANGASALAELKDAALLAQGDAEAHDLARAQDDMRT